MKNIVRVRTYSATIVRHVLLVIYAIMALFPFIWILISSFKDNKNIFTKPFALPESLNFDNFVKAWEVGGIAVFFKNSLVITSVTVILQTFIVAMAAYILTRVLYLKFLMSYLLLGLMIPIHAMLIPDFLTIRSIGLMNSPLGVILIYCAANTSFGIYLLAGFMKGIPYELDEAAMIDGVGYAGIFFRIIIPVSKSALATTATFSFLNSWNEFLFATVILTKKINMTITQGINYLKGQYVTDYGLLCAGLLFIIMPVVIMYVFFQEQMVKGMTAGAVKG